jgi:hypothetical protein
VQPDLAPEDLGNADLEAARTAFDALALRYFTTKEEHGDELHAACVALAVLLRRAR